MATPSPRLGLPTIDGEPRVTVFRTAINSIASKLDRAALYAQGVIGARPPAGLAGSFYRNTVSGDLFVDDGTTWQHLASPAMFAIGDAAPSATSLTSSPVVLNLGTAGASLGGPTALFARVGGSTSPGIQVAEGGLYRTRAVVERTRGTADPVHTITLGGNCGLNSMLPLVSPTTRTVEEGLLMPLGANDIIQFTASTSYPGIGTPTPTARIISVEIERLST